MTIYLTIMTTILVATQVIRIAQNTINLFRQKKEIERNIEWFKEREVKKEDFDCQREVMYLLREKLRERKKTLNEVRAEYGLPPVEKEECEQE